MLDTDIKRRIDTARDILVGMVLNPMSQDGNNGGAKPTLLG